MSAAVKAKLAYTIAESAEATGVSIDTIRREIRDGRLVAVYLRGVRVIPADVLHRWVQAAPPEPRRSAS